MESQHSAVTIRRMRFADVPAAARILRSAFESTGLPSPEGFGSVAEDAHVLSAWLKREPGGVFVAEAAGEILGSAVAYHWGTLGMVGPLTVAPLRWGRGIGRALMKRCLEAFEQWGCTIEKLHTYADSPRHLAFFQKCGLHSSGACLLLSRGVHAAPSSGPRKDELLSSHLAGRRAKLIAEMREITEHMHPGLVLDVEIHGRVPPHAEVLLLRREGRLEGFAGCDVVESSAVRTCHVKFGAVRQGIAADGFLSDLMSLVESFALGAGCQRVVLGMSTDQWTAASRALGTDWRMQARTLCMIHRGMEKHLVVDSHIFFSWL